jgi:hypothetical protein
MSLIVGVSDFTPILPQSDNAINFDETPPTTPIDQRVELNVSAPANSVNSFDSLSPILRNAGDAKVEKGIYKYYGLIRVGVDGEEDLINFTVFETTE